VSVEKQYYYEFFFLKNLDQLELTFFSILRDGCLY
jgi:hypothetical protein